MYPAKTAIPIEMPFVADSGGPKEPCIRGGRDSTWKGAIFGGSLKSIGSRCCGVRSKTYNLIVNNLMQRRKRSHPESYIVPKGLCFADVTFFLINGPLRDQLSQNVLDLSSLNFQDTYNMGEHGQSDLFRDHSKNVAM